MRPGTAAEVVALLQTLRDAHGFDMLVDVTAIDWAEGANPRFTVVYHLYGTVSHVYFRVATDCTGDDSAPVVPSATGLWPAADWHERETWDMFGVVFDGHPHLTRILMPDDWVGHPQRKDYPLGGIPVEYKGAEVPPPDQRRSYR